MRYDIAPTAGAGGSITPSGTVSVITGANAVFLVKADPGFVIDTVTANGTPLTVYNSKECYFAVTCPTHAGSISATFRPA